MEEHQLGSAARASGGMGTEDTTMIERVEPTSFAAAGDRLLVHLSAACPGDPQATPESCAVLVEEPERLVQDSTSQKKDAEKLEFEASTNFWKFQDLANELQK